MTQTRAVGWIDLKTGELRPSMEGRLHQDRRPPAQYLAFLRHHRPVPPGSASTDG